MSQFMDDPCYLRTISLSHYSLAASVYPCVFCLFFHTAYIYICYIIVTQWSGLGGIEAEFLGPYLPSVL